MGVSVQAKEAIDLDSDVMNVVCDSENPRLEALLEKLEGFYEGLDEDERRFMQFALAGGEKANRDPQLLGGVEAFQSQIRELRQETDFAPVASGPPCILTVLIRC